MPKRILIVGPKCTANNKVILFKTCGELSLFLQYTANILLLKNTTFGCVFFPCTSSALLAFNYCPKYSGYTGNALGI